MSDRFFTLPWCTRISALLLAALIGAAHFPLAAVDAVRLQAALRRFGGPASAFVDWQTMMQHTKDLPVADRLKRVNEFFNRRIQYAEDRDVWGVEDYWATPMETLAKGKGDCEDFTIAKYFTLLNLNIPVERLRLVYVKARIGGASSTLQQAHMVLAYYPSPTAEPLLLDSLITDIRPAARRPDLQPVFSFNSEGIFNGAAADAAQGPGGIGQLSKWSDLLRRARAEGFD